MELFQQHAYSYTRLILLTVNSSSIKALGGHFWKAHSVGNNIPFNKKNLLLQLVHNSTWLNLAQSSVKALLSHKTA